MNKRKIVWTVALCLMVTVPCATANGGTDDVAHLMRLMPADSPVSVIVVDLEKLDKSISSAQKRFDPGSTEPGILDELKGEVGKITEWVDFSKPIGMAAPSLRGGKEGILWLWASDFSANAKTVEGASEEEGVWTLPFGEDKTVFAKVKGDYVLVADTKEMLAKGMTGDRTLLDELKPRMDLLKDRDALIHINFGPLRPQVLGGVAQAAQMAPMLAMMASQGGDPTALTALFTGGIDAAKKFIEQVAYVDISIALGDEAADVTLASGFMEGPIRNYLAKQKPASLQPFADIPEQPYVLAVSSHLPGKEWPIVDYFFDQAASAVQPSPMAGEGVAAAKTDAMKKAMQAARDLYRGYDGFNMVMAMSTDGMRVLGDYISQDPESLLTLLKQFLAGENPLMQQFKPGVKYEALGSRKIGKTAVEEYAVKVDETNPMGAQILALYGANPRFALGVTGKRVRFCVGAEEDMHRAFGGKVDKPFTSGRFVQEAIAKLPARRNAVILVDPAGILPMLAPMMGRPSMDAIPPGPPIAIAASLVGDPARVDIHVPLRAIERVIQATAPEEPM